jgi:Cd(II)/Pb(II)-responsive transcriptional regulator
MRIGNLAEATGTAVETIRFYEREGLLPAAGRTDNNYREYTPAHAERLAFIRRCRSLDMALDEIRALLALRDAGDAGASGCDDVNALLDAHIGHVSERMRELRALLAELKTLRASCAGPLGLEPCGILNALDTAARTGSRQAKRRHVHGAH